MRGGGGFGSKKLLEAFAVLAVVFVVLAALPAAVTGSDSADTTPSYEEGVIAAGYAKDAELAAAMVNSITGGNLTVGNVADSTVFMVFHMDGGKYNEVEYSRSVNDIEVTTPPASEAQRKETGTLEAKTVYYMFTVQRGIDSSTNADCIDAGWSENNTYTLTVKLTGPDGASNTITADVEGETVTLYQDATMHVNGPFVAENGSDVVLDLNDHELTINNSNTAANRTFTAAEKSSLSIVGNDREKSKLNINGSKTDDRLISSVVGADKDAKVTVQNITYTTNGAALLPAAAASSVTITNSDITAPVHVVGTNNAYLEHNGTNVKITISGSTLTGTKTNEATPVYINTKGVKLDISDSTITGQRHAVVVVAGEATIKNSTLVSSNEGSSVAGWTQGNDVTPGTLFVGNSFDNEDGPYNGEARVTVDGGRIIAKSGAAVSTEAYKSKNGETTVDLVIGKDANTTITCGEGESEESVVVSNLKYVANKNTEGNSPLVMKVGSVDLSGTIDSLKIVKGEVTVSSNLVITSIGKLIVSTGATLVIDEEAAIVVDSTDSIVFEPDSSVIGQENIKDAKGTVVVPDYEDGAIVYKDGIAYTIYHAKTTAGTVQFGVAVGNMVYDGNDKGKDPFKNIAIASFDRLYTSVSAINDGKITNPNGDECVDAGTYDLAVSFTMSNGYGSVKVDAVGLTVDILKAESKPSVTIEGWSYGAWDATENAPVIGYEGLVKEDVDPGYETIEYYFDGEEVADKDSIDEYLEELKAGSYNFEVEFSGSKNYADATAVCEFTVGKAAMSVDVVEPDAKEEIFGKNPGDFVDMGDYDVSFEDGEVSVTGTINYITNVNELVGQKIFPDEEKSGYFAVFQINNNNDFAITVQYGKETNKPATIEAGGHETWMIYLGELDVSDTIHVTPQNEDYAEMEIQISYSFGRETQAGYGATKAEADAQITGATGVELTDVIDRTMWILWTQSAQDGEVYGNLKLANSNGIIYEEKQKTDAGIRIWYFSFNQQILRENPSGVYTLQIVNEKDGETTEITSIDVIVPGVVDTGFEMNSDDAYNRIKEDFRSAGGDFTNKSDVAPKTLWMVYSQYGMEGKNLIAKIYYNDGEEPIWSEHAKDANGLRCVYVSFDDLYGQLKGKLNAGTYTIEIVSREPVTIEKDGEKYSTTVDIPIYKGTYTIGQIDSKVSFSPATDAELAFSGKKAIDIQINIDIEMSKEGDIVNVKGQLFRLNGFENFYGEGKDGKAGYYLAFTMKADGFDLSKAMIENNFHDFVRNGQTYIVYLGNELSEGMRFGEITVDFDGKEGTFYKEQTYTFEYTFEAKRYDVILVDEDYYGTGGLKYDSYIIDGIFNIPNGPNPDKEFLGWYDINRKHYDALSAVVITKEMIGEDGVIKFIATYAAPVQPVDPTTYDIVFTYKVGGESAVYRTVTAVEGKIITLPAPPAGYVAWAINGSILSGQYIVNADDATDGTITIVAVEADKETAYTVGFEGVDLLYLGVYAGDVISLPALPEGAVAWTVNANVIVGQYIVFGADANEDGVITINAKMAPADAVVIFVYGTKVVEKTVDLQSKIAFPADATKDGYTLAWFVGDEQIDETYVVTGDVTVVADYTEIPVVPTTGDVYFVYGGQYAIETLTLGETLAVPEEIDEAAHKDGCTFVWTVNGEAITEKTVVVDGMVVIAQYTEIPATTGDVIFVYGGQYAIETLTLRETLAVPEKIDKAAQKDSCTLVWTVDGEAITDETVVVDGMVVIAQYTEIPATTAVVTFVYGTKVVENTVDLQSKIVFPADATKDGYTLAWFVGDKQIDETYVVTGDVTVVADYTEDEKPIVYSTNMTVSLKDVDGTIYYSISAFDGKAIPGGVLTVFYNYTVVDENGPITLTGREPVTIQSSGSSLVSGTVSIPSNLNVKSITGVFQCTVSDQTMSERSATVYL